MALRAAQRAWIEYRDTSCRWYASGAGSIARLESVECMRSLTAARALELDPRSAEAHTSAAYIQHRYEWRFADAERAFKTAIALQPNYALARHWYASFLESMNRHGEAIAQSAKAEELEPVSPVISTCRVLS